MVDYSDFIVGVHICSGHENYSHLIVFKTLHLLSYQLTLPLTFLEDVFLLPEHLTEMITGQNNSMMGG